MIMTFEEKYSARTLAEQEAKTLAGEEIKAMELVGEKLKAAAEALAEAKVKIESEAKLHAAAERSRRPKGGKLSKNGWFYTCEGNRLGPVTFDELRSMAAVSSLDPRRDMVWKQGMDAWKPAGKIDGLFERNNAPVETGTPKPFLQPVLSHIVPPQETPRAIKTKGDAPWPGARRRSLWFALLVFPVVWHFALAYGGPHLVKHFGEVLMSRILPLAVFMPIAVLVHFGLKRLLNLGMSRWWLLAFFAPVLNLWIGYRCLACPSGYAQQRKIDTTGIVLAVIYWLVMLAVVSVIGIALAPLFGSLDMTGLPARLRAWLLYFSA